MYKLEYKEVVNIKNLKTQLEQKKGTLDIIDNEILAICDVTTIEKEIDESEEINYKITEALNKMEHILTRNQR